MPVKAKLKKENSQKLFKRACKLLPGGVNSPVRAFKSIDNQPLFIKRAQGAYLWDEDDNQFIDFVGSWGPMILGHNDPHIKSAIEKALINGTSFGAPTAIENHMAEKVIRLVPSIEMVRFVNSGTEAVLSAIRLAKAFAGQINPNKSKIIKFSGCYHGHVDQLLVQAGSGIATLGLPDSLGVSTNSVAETIVLPFNNLEILDRTFNQYSEEIAAVILEPIIGNSGFIYPKPGYLEHLRQITKDKNCLLIFDEVMTGFRVSLGGAQERFNIKPDITCLGKVIGGGLPVGAYGASKEIMSLVAPLGSMYQAGTLSGNPIAMSAGLACLEQIEKPGFYEELENKTKYLCEGLTEICRKHNNPKIKNAQFGYAGGMFGFFFTEKPIYNYEDAKANLDTELFKNIYLAMLEQGVYLAPSAFEAGFISSSHSYADLDRVLAGFRIVLQ